MWSTSTKIHIYYGYDLLLHEVREITIQEVPGVAMVFIYHSLRDNISGPPTREEGFFFFCYLKTDPV